MPSLLKTALAVAALAAAVMAVDGWLDGRATKWELQVASATAVAEAKDREAQAHKARADSLSLVADSLFTVAEDRRPTIIRLQAAVDSTPAPPSPALALRDTLIHELREENSDLRASIAAERSAKAELMLANAALQVRGDSLQDVLNKRPSRRPAWLPSVTVGPFAGICSTGTTCTGAGVHLSWRISF